MAYEFIEGMAFIEFLESGKADKKTTLRIITNIFKQLFAMDKLKINKEEMSHPVKHIIITNKNKPVLLDFERCHHVKNPGNVTQFCDFLISNRVLTLLNKKEMKIYKERIIMAAKDYRKKQSWINFEKILNNLR